MATQATPGTPAPAVAPVRRPLGAPDPGSAAQVAAPLLEWYSAAARDLPWRSPTTTAWQVLVSEVMLQQTPVARVVPVYLEWVARWPTPAALAAQAPGEAVRAWGRLGYPRRALRLHAAAAACVEHHAGEVPDDPESLRGLPGVGEYTAAAVAAFAFGRRIPVLDTNVRRVLARLLDGRAFERPGSPTRDEVDRAWTVLPERAEGARTSAALMELGAVVCTARSPVCRGCPVADRCAWYAAGRPEWDGPPRRGQTYAGTDRQCRGRLLAVLREACGPVSRATLDATWGDAVQRERALDGLVADGLVEPLPRGRYRLPGTTAG